MMTSHDGLALLQKVVRRLEDAKIPYFLTGSMALNFYGMVRATNDYDIVIAIEPWQANALCQAFQDDSYIAIEAVHDAIARRTMFNVIDNASVFKIDFIVAADDATTMRQFERRRIIDLGNLQVAVISPEDLILAKLAWARTSQSQLQYQDIQNLCASLKDELDITYVRTWAKRDNTHEVFERLYEQS